MSFRESKEYKNSNTNNESPMSQNSKHSPYSDSSPDELSDNDNNGSGDEKIQDILNRMSTKPKSVKISQNHLEHNKKDPNAIHYDDLEFDKLEENDRKALKDLFMGLPDIYKITGTSPEDSQTTINKKCAEKLKMYHPDRHSELVKKYPEEQRTKELKKLDIQFKLLRDADSILRNPSKRKYYDLQKKTVNSKNYVAQKESFEDFIKLQKSKMSEQSEKIAKTDHKLAFLALDQKHGFDRKKFEESALTVEETNRRFNDLELGRQQDEIEFVPKNRFEEIPYTPDDFNKMFVRNKLKEDKKRGKHGSDSSIIAWEGISAANDTGMEGATDFVSIDHNYEDLYTDKNFNGASLYASRLDSDIESVGSESSFDMGDDEEWAEHDGYKLNKDDINNKFEQMMSRRTLENKEYDNREMHDKESWKSVLDNPFTISSSMGTVLGGTDFSQLDGPKRKKVIGKDYADVYKSLVYENSEEEKLNSEQLESTETIKENAHKIKKDNRSKNRDSHVHKSSKHDKEKKDKNSKHHKSIKSNVKVDKDNI